jgi:malate synthase
VESTPRAYRLKAGNAASPISTFSGAIPEKFFIATDELEDKKLEVIGWTDPKIATKAIKDSAKSFLKDGE